MYFLCLVCSAVVFGQKYCPRTYWYIYIALRHCWKGVFELMLNFSGREKSMRNRRLSMSCWRERRKSGGNFQRYRTDIFFFIFAHKISRKEPRGGSRYFPYFFIAEQICKLILAWPVPYCTLAEKDLTGPSCIEENVCFCKVGFSCKYSIGQLSLLDWIDDPAFSGVFIFFALIPRAFGPLFFLFPSIRSMLVWIPIS